MAKKIGGEREREREQTEEAARLGAINEPLADLPELLLRGALRLPDGRRRPEVQHSGAPPPLIRPNR